MGRKAMRFFALLNFQHIILYVFPTLVFIVLFGLALGYSHVRRKDSEERKKAILYLFPDGIEGRNAPFPLVLVLTIVGTLIWAFFYILMIGVLEVKI
jgi:hypothetical protein